MRSILAPLSSMNTKYLVGPYKKSTPHALASTLLRFREFREEAAAELRAAKASAGSRVFLQLGDGQDGPRD